MSDEKNRARAHVVGPAEGRSLLGGFAVYKLLGQDTGGAFSVVEHHLQPGTLGAPMHTHHDVDEMSYVLEGEIGARIGDDEVHAGPGALVLKPKGIPHTFWNAGSSPARLLEVIWPAGFERYFEELDHLLSAAGGQPDPAQMCSSRSATVWKWTSGASPSSCRSMVSGWGGRVRAGPRLCPGIISRLIRRDPFTSDAGC